MYRIGRLSAVTVLALALCVTVSVTQVSAGTAARDVAVAAGRAVNAIRRKTCPGTLVRDEHTQATVEYHLGCLTVAWSRETMQLRILSSATKGAMWWTVPEGAFVRVGTGTFKATEDTGNFVVRNGKKSLSCEQTIEKIEAAADKVVVTGTLGGGPLTEDMPYTVTLGPYEATQEEGQAQWEGLGVRSCLASLTVAVAGSVHHNISANILDRSEFQRRKADKHLNHVVLKYGCNKDETFHGFGQQYTYFDLKGKLVPIISTEQGIGRGLQPLTAILNKAAKFAGGSWHTTYSAVPAYLSGQGRGVVVHNSEYLSFDLREEDQVVVDVVTDTLAPLAATVIGAKSPAAAMHGLTSLTGRMEPLPEWSQEGAVVGMQGGTAEVRRLVAELQSAGVPLTGVWLQDWTGQRIDTFGTRLWWNWEVDTDHYPGWEDMLRDFAKDGIRVFVYLNPYVADVTGRKSYRRNLFKEAEDLGYLVKNPSGDSYILSSGSTEFTFGMMDLSNDDAAAWYERVIRCNALCDCAGGCTGTSNDTSAVVGAAGWMADFGEYMPFDAVLHKGTPATEHNLYPERWAQVNQRAVASASESKRDAVYFMRSGATRSPQHSALFWMGDQLVTWDIHDGLHSALVGMLSSGLSGWSLAHSDVGGYTMVDKYGVKYQRSAELLMRWTELSCFADAFLRTHQGLQPEGSPQVWTDDASKAHFAKFARMHMALAPYRRLLMAEARYNGMPLTRPMLLHYPDDAVASRLTTQFMLGPELLVAPVLKKRAVTVKAYLPRGLWVHAWSGEVHGCDGSRSEEAGARITRTPQSVCDEAEELGGGLLFGVHVTVAAPIGHPAVFTRLLSEAGGSLHQLLRSSVAGLEA